MTDIDIDGMVDRLVDEYRARCLWFLREGYYPSTDEERLRVLDCIERYGDVAAYRRAAEIRQWLSRTSSARSVRQRPAFVEAEVSRDGDTVLMEWARDSAYRFFPLVRHHDLGLTLHPFDLATNKVLALVGRVEARDWIDVIHASERIQPLAYLVWAACGKDPGFSPRGILEYASRSARYSGEEIQALSFSDAAPDPADLSRRWHAMLAAAPDIIALLPSDAVGRCVLDRGGHLFGGGVIDLARVLDRDAIVFHAGSVRGALPRAK